MKRHQVLFLKQEWFLCGKFDGSSPSSFRFVEFEVEYFSHAQICLAQASSQTVFFHMRIE